MFSKICATFFVLAVLTQSINCSYETYLGGLNDARQRKLEIMLQLIENDVQKVCPGTKTEYREATISLMKCVANLDYYEETICSNIQILLSSCLKPVTKYFEKCLSEDGKAVPSFIVKSLLSTYNYLCKSDVEHALELMSPCVTKSTRNLDRCTRMAVSKMQRNELLGNNITKEFLCNMSSEIKTCILSHVTASCRNPITRDSYTRFVEASLQACSANNIQ